MEITDGKTINRQDLRSTHEDADVIIIQHAISSSMNGKRVTVMCEDTDVFVLLLHFYHKWKNNGLFTIIMAPIVKERAVVDTGATAAAHSDIADDILAVHGITGAVRVASLHGIGKVTAINVFKKGTRSLSYLDDAKASLEKVHEQATNFICNAYGKFT